MNRFLIVLSTTLLLALPARAQLSTVEGDVIKGTNAFAVELYGQLKNQPGNLFFSPESISTALAMTYAGARGETATEMANTLHFALPPEQLHPAMGALLRDLNAAHDGYQLKVANALWGQQDYTFLDDFLKLTNDDYGAGFNQVDFKGATETARQNINHWVEQRTDSKIKDLIAPGLLDNTTRLVLTNAIYFEGDWETQFKKEDTKEEDFHVSSLQTIKALLMHRFGGFNYFDGRTFQALEIPYKNKELSMIAFLPMGVDGLTAFEQSLTAEKMQQWLGQLKPAWTVIVTMPKFKLETAFSLNDVLQVMGTKKAFDERLADFSGMASKSKGSPQHDGNLYINDVIHKAYVDVNEKGTEAAAATAVIMVSPATAAPPPPPRPIIFRADHPFLFLIRDNKSGGILFLGRVSDPSK